ncbi:glutathione S-transferase family protein [Paraburkholderia diazotrophica]|uniref:Glutathione S-transferase n=1 Tax=Paraburkholderia diazotrophica TaxID=667676 RepID=A0A1H6WFM8_9BURK|nr:glutathione S-transferase family protein [Paraburkholderia diazotrophica]SEJ15821.1 Glutathione S-transferase [Paraburkholderia diazotrophica]
MIVYKFGDGSGAMPPDLSPFVVKLETWLRFSGIPYEGRIGNLNAMPKKKLPVAVIDGVTVNDSSAIIDYLQHRHPNALSDVRLDRAQRARSAAIKALLETHLYFVIVYLRWAVDSNMAIYRPYLIEYARLTAPPPARALIGAVAPAVIPIIRRKVLRQVWEQGIARHGYDEIVRMGIDAWQAIADLLGDQPYLLGDEPTTVDATCFAWIHTTAMHAFESPVRDFVAKQPALMAYHERIAQRCWPELAKASRGGPRGPSA